jgi:hypothetical protein
MARAVADWWDSVELWLTQLPFPLQVLLALVVVVPAAWGGAAAFDRLWEVAAARFAASGQAPDAADDPAVRR